MSEKLKIALLAGFIGFIGCRAGQNLLNIYFMKCVNSELAKITTIHDIEAQVEAAQKRCMPPGFVIRILFW